MERHTSSVAEARERKREGGTEGEMSLVLQNPEKGSEREEPRERRDVFCSSRTQTM